LGNPIHINENVENHILVAGGIGRAGLAYLTEELKRLDRRAIFFMAPKMIGKCSMRIGSIIVASAWRLLPKSKITCSQPTC